MLVPLLDIREMFLAEAAAEAPDAAVRRADVEDVLLVRGKAEGALHATRAVPRAPVALVAGQTVDLEEKKLYEERILWFFSSSGVTQLGFSRMFQI